LCRVALCVNTGCGTDGNSAQTERASEQLREAQAKVSAHSKDLTQNQEDIEHRQRALVSEQQQLADKQKLLERQRRDLGSAQDNLRDTRAAYAAAIKERFAKLDVAVAALATRTDARSRDAVTGLRARRDSLLAKIDAMATTPAPDWNTYTRDVDVTFDAIEHDLHDAD
jgi:peptidoglycan hydrolase CwlO-like protein